MTDDEPTPDLAIIRDLLNAAFTDKTLRRFCQERPTFRPILAEFSSNHGMNDMVDWVIDYCQTKLLWRELLAAVREENPSQYARFEPGLRGFARLAYTPPPPPPLDVLPDPGDLPPGSRLDFLPNPLFTGRDEQLKALARTLFHDQAPSTLVTQAVQGMGGVGKTQLAVEFAYRYGRYFQGVHWLNAAQPDSLPAEVAACGQEMGLAPWPRELPDQVALTLKVWQRNGPRLIILDNLEDMGATRQWLLRLRGKGVRLLLTARRSDWPRTLGLTPLRLEVFTPAESLAFLRRYLPNGRAADTDLQALAGHLGHLPLALELAGRYLDYHRRLTIHKYRKRLEEVLAHSSMTAWRADLGNPTGHDLDLVATFALSWERQEISPAARRLFRMAGYCAPNQPIPCELLEQAAQLDGEGCDEALGTLTGLGLLKMEDPQAGPTVHPLLAEYARTVPALPGEESPLPALAAALARMASAANRQVDQTGDLAHFAPVLPHLPLVAGAAEKEDLEDAGALWNSLGYHLRGLADHAGARTAFERALAILEKVLGADHPNVATLVNNLGLVLKDLGDHAGARAAFERALAIDEAVFGSDHPTVAIRVNNLGLVLQDLGDHAGARAAYERALAILERFLPSDHPHIRIVRENLEQVGE